MRIALVNATAKQKVYPLALLKLGAWRKSLGDTCQVYQDRLPESGQFDEIWVTTLFTFEIPHALGIIDEAMNRAPIVRVGGIAASLLPDRFEHTGAEVVIGLVPEAEKFSPDYSLLGHAPKYSIAHTSRGCVRKCGFCMVHRLESEFIDRPHWEQDIDRRTNKVLFFDNNWLAKDMSAVERDVLTMRRLIAEGRIKQVDFNQGLDCRLLTDDHVDLLKGLPMRPVRFAFDGMQEDGSFQRAVERMAAVGYHNFMNYTLYNYKDTPADFYYRLREQTRLSEVLGISCCAFPMRFQPILEADAGRDYVGDKWIMAQRKGFMALLACLSTNGQVSFGSIAEFEYWFGKSAEEFSTLLAYPKIRLLAERRAGALRTKRAAERGAA